MSLGLEQSVAEYLVSKGIGLGLYDDVAEGNRSVFVGEYTPGEDSNGLGITVFPDGGPPPMLTIRETTTITIQCRHRSYETAMSTQREIHELLQENGGQSNGANPEATGDFPNGIKVGRITADFQPIALGRDSDGGDGRAVTSQSFTVRSKPITFT